MAAISFEGAINEGGGNIHFAFHISGEPYIIVTSNDLKTVLDTPDTSARRRILGTTQIDGNYLADSTTICPVFTGLQQPGKETWTLHETKGLRSSGFNIEIENYELGHTWSHFGSTKADGTVRRGLPGIHHYAQPLVDSTCGAVELREDLRSGDTTLTVYNSGMGTVWETAVESESDYRLQWLGQECIAVNNSVSGTDPHLSVTVEKRGVFRTRDQHHFIDDEFGANPLVYDVPPSVIGQTCWVWACLLDNDSSAMIGDPVLVREGPINAGITTKEGVTRITVNSILQNLEDEFKVDGWNGSFLAKHIFTRDVSGTKESHVYDNFEAPHLTILEWDGSNYKSKHLWLCDQNDGVVFDSAGDVIAALLEEMDKCSRDTVTEATAFQSQVSGDGAAGTDNARVELDYRYTYEQGRIFQTDKNGSASDKLSIFTGPLAWLYNLGPICNLPEVAIEDMLNNPAPGWFYSFYTAKWDNWVRVPPQIPWMMASPPSQVFPIGDAADPFHPQPKLWLGGWTGNGRAQWITEYFYSWQWSSADLGGWSQLIPNGTTYGEQKESTFNLPDPLGSDYIYFYPETKTGILKTGDILQFGRATDKAPVKRICQATISAISTSDTYPTITLSPVFSRASGHPTPFRYGAGMWYVPGLEKYRQDPTPIQTSEEQTPLAPNAEGRGLRYVLDPWQAGQLAALSTNSLGDLYRAILGDSSASVTVEDGFQKKNIIGFTTEDDFISIIDWDDLSNKTQAARDLLNIKYRADFSGEIKILDALWADCRLHGVAPVLEWDAPLYRFMIRFRKMGAANISRVFAEGRSLDETNLTAGRTPTEHHSSTWIANKAELKLNYIEDKYHLTFPVKLYSSHMSATDKDTTIKVESKFSHIEGGIDDDARAKIIAFFRSYMRFFAQPQWVNDNSGGIDLMTKIALGRECLMTDSTAKNPIDQELGLTNQPTFITKMGIDFDKDAAVTFSYRITSAQSYGWAPAMLVAANKSTKGAGPPYTIELDVSTTLNEFSIAQTRPDFTYFDCYEYNRSKGAPTSEAAYTLKTSCSCGDYVVIAHEVGDRTGTDLGVGVATLKVTEVDITGQTVTLTDSSVGHDHYNAWDVTKPYVIFFGGWTYVEPCQQNWIYFADTDNELSDGEPGMRWE